MNSATYRFKSAICGSGSFDESQLMEACDILNQTEVPDAYEQLIDYARHQLKSGTHRTKKLTLMGLSFMAEHCSRQFLEALANPVLMSAMKHLAVNHYSKKHKTFTSEVGLLAAQAIEEWSRRCPGDPGSPSAFSKTHERLLKKDVVIPPKKLSRGESRARTSREEDVNFPKDVSESLKSASDTIELVRSVMMQERRESEPAFQELLKGLMEELRTAKKRLASQTEEHVKNEIALFFLLESIDSIDTMMEQCKKASTSESPESAKNEQESKPIYIKANRNSGRHSLDFGQQDYYMAEQDLYESQQLNQEFDEYPSFYDDNTLVLNNVPSPLSPAAILPSSVHAQIESTSPSVLYRAYNSPSNNSISSPPIIQKQNLLPPNLHLQQNFIDFLPSRPFSELPPRQSPWNPFTQLENGPCTTQSSLLDAPLVPSISQPSAQLARNPSLPPSKSDGPMRYLLNRPALDWPRECTRDKFS
ncbi:uncharacterized protein LOC126316968 [Schistocerca gregaria]|uniref:uncharacterized protein LOC126316968 n=1 Tax=Schistocerca gregaria TaxID=7010 RepID=UPI00211DFDAB|nr:uncharacterized protein LOC126316968 [Schistocerca gregaria]